ncbi:hypothetical protein [Aquifex sp.]
MNFLLLIILTALSMYGVYKIYNTLKDIRSIDIEIIDTLTLEDVIKWFKEELEENKNLSNYNLKKFLPITKILVKN